MKTCLIFSIIISSLIFTNAFNEKHHIVNLKANTELDLIGVLETLLDVKDEISLHEIIVILTQNAMLDTIDSPKKPDNYDELLENWIIILTVLEESGTGSVLIKDLKPYISRIKQNKLLIL